MSASYPRDDAAPRPQHIDRVAVGREMPVIASGATRVMTTCDEEGRPR
jgi:predicted DNA repair protein MutK